MPIYNIVSKDDIFVAIDLLSSTAFDELEGFKKQGFLILEENIEAGDSEEAIRLCKIGQGLSHEYVDSVYISTCSILPKNKELEEVLGVVSATDRTGLGVKRQLAEYTLNKLNMRFNANTVDIEAMKIGVINYMRMQCLDLGGNAVIDISVQVQEISGSGTSLFLVSGTGTACIITNA
ncbi:heavy metal-binding domain-containing protein [Vibrio genomosp. F10]|uniref:heavy metal-binding domain-containing protein n=1 Tax=Vibrio genomosp. F10 TaxID=723171 RepID=UPI0002E122B2|nr:heavy metal-binding domain-containing protein [Vibrio genomosp. F10]OEF05941.1 hypothetical protein A1QI_07170 [Vibrio genomosp. F10 str. 9ZB36]